MAGILPDVFWSLTWNDYDSLLFNHRYREQQALRGHREVAKRIYNSIGAFAKSFRALSAEEYWPLPLVDPAPTAAVLPPPEWWAKMEALAARSGKHFAIAKD